MRSIKAIYDLFWNKDDLFWNEAEMFWNIVCTGISWNSGGFEFVYYFKGISINVM